MRIPNWKTLITGTLSILAAIFYGIRQPIALLSDLEYLVGKMGSLWAFLLTDVGNLVFIIVFLVVGAGFIAYGLFRPGIQAYFKKYIPKWLMPSPRLTYDMLTQHTSEVNKRLDAVERHFAVVTQDPSRLLGDLFFEYKSVDFEKDLLQPILYFRFEVQNRSQFHWLRPTGKTTGEINIDNHPLVGVLTFITLDPDGGIPPGGYCLLKIGIAVNDRLYTYLTESDDKRSPLMVNFHGLKLEISGRNDRLVQRVLGSISPAVVATVLLTEEPPW